MTDIHICNLCSSANLEKLYHITISKPEFDVVRCKDCNLIFQNPRFTDDEINSFYNQDYYEGTADYTYIDERENFKGSAYVWDKRIKSLIKHLNKKSGKNLKFLDIGCSFGGFISRAKLAGFDVWGIDISAYATEYARNHLGLNNVVCGELDEKLYEDNFFDVITMIEVIEHVKDPKKVIKQIYSLTKPGGIALIQTANMDGHQAKSQKQNYHYFLPGHLFYFSKKTLVRYLKEAGFSKVKVFHGVDFGLLPKLKKSAGNFKKFLDYLSWLKITYYHLKSKIHIKDFALTSSMVIYAFK